ncbi:MAG: hypothetical protein RJB66_729 [Pseudomonadota bacterium]|jgi:hypothetical protein
MAILVATIFCIFTQFAFGAQDATSGLPQFVEPEFDWKAWERLSLQEKERNVLWRNKAHPDHCEPIKEYREMMNFFRSQKDEINPSEALARQLAAEISKGCDGAARRFVKTFLFLKKSGVDHTRSIEYALEFSKTDQETVDNFFELFKKTYLGEYFDLDYSSALRISFELSKLYKGNRKQAREDFLQISKFCLEKTGLNLPVTQCADLSVSMARWSQYYPDGIRDDFFKLYRILRDDKRFGVSIKTSINIIREVLPYGPKSVQNFIRSYEYAIDPTGLASGGVAAIKFALSMAKNSVKTWPPPIYTPPKIPEGNPKIHAGATLGSQYQADSQRNASEGGFSSKEP